MPHVYERDENGDRVMFHKPTQKWFAYAFGTFQGECVRGKGDTKQQAVENSIKNTKEE